MNYTNFFFELPMKNLHPSFYYMFNLFFWKCSSSSCIIDTEFFVTHSLAGIFLLCIIAFLTCKHVYIHIMKHCFPFMHCGFVTCILKSPILHKKNIMLHNLFYLKGCFLKKLKNLIHLVLFLMKSEWIQFKAFFFFNVKVIFLAWFLEWPIIPSMIINIISFME